MPKTEHYLDEVFYQAEAKPAAVDKDLFVALDLGVSVLAALTSNKPDFSPAWFQAVRSKPSTNCITSSGNMSRSNARKAKTSVIPPIA